MANCNTSITCSDYITSCTDVLTCVNEDLNKILTDQTHVLDNFCLVTNKCVNTQLELITNDQSNSYDYFGPAVVQILKSLDGYSPTGFYYLTLDEDSISWDSLSPGTTFVTGGLGIIVTGSGPFEVSLDQPFTRALFTGSNGITYNNSTGAFKLGGSLTENTTISGNASTYDLALSAIDLFTVTGNKSVLTSTYSTLSSILTLDPVNQLASLRLNKGSDAFIVDLDGTMGLNITSTTDLTLEATNNSFFKIALYGSASNGDVLTLVDNATGEVAWVTPTAIPGSYTDENAQDAVGSILVDSLTIDFTYNDGTPSITASVIDDSITFTKIQNISTDRILGRDAAGTGNVEELTVGGGIEFTGSGGLQTSAFTGDVVKTLGGTALTIANDAVTNSKLRDSTGYSVIGKSTTGTGDPADIVAANDTVLRRSGSGDLQFGTIVTNNVGDDQITFAKMQNISTQRILGRSTAGTGDVEALGVGNNLSLSAGVLDTYGRTLIGITKFYTSGTWTKPTGCNAVLVLVVGGGGGGAGATSIVAEAAVGSGGGAGGHHLKFITAALGATETVTVGAGGAGGSSTSTVPWDGENGGTSSFGSFADATGGTGGFSISSGTSTLVYYGGSAGLTGITNSDTVYGGAGNQGGTAIRLSGSVVVAGKGGASILGGGGNEYSYGSGGDGRQSIGAASDDGYNGTAGVVVVYEYS